jgi:hypothetical protein
MNNPPVLIVTAILVTNAAESRPEAKNFSIPIDFIQESPALQVAQDLV